ncbi:MAG: hypothetical protein NTX40_01020 [Planctomycetota bacterium]|nr:hypothetical protein [Planctomycetota bacterium]
MKATGLVLAVGALLMSLVACSTRAAEGQEPADELHVLQAENEMLKRQRTGYLKYVENQAQEILRLKALLKEASIDPEQKADAEPVGDQSKEPPAPAGGIAAAIRRHLEEAKAVAESQDTDIQKRTAWLQAARRLNEALGRGTILIEYEVEEVQFEADTNTALLTFSSAKVEDLEFQEFYGMRIFADEKTALSIKKGSRATLRGLATLGVDFSKPASEQPAFSRSPEQSYRPTAYVFSYLRFTSSWHLGKLILAVKRDCLVEVDGVRRALQEVEVLPREKERPPQKQRRSLPPPPVIRVKPRIVR